MVIRVQKKKRKTVEIIFYTLHTTTLGSVASQLKVLTDISAEVLLFELDVARALHRLGQSLSLVLTIRTYGYDAATCSDETAILDSGTCMEHYTAFDVGTRDLVALVISLRITS